MSEKPNQVTKLYHTTLRRNLPSIMKHGLIPKFPRDDSTDPKAIFFLACKELAQLICLEDEVVIEACLSNEQRIFTRFLGSEEVYEYFVFEKIPPSYLKVMPYKEPKSCRRDCGFPKGCFSSRNRLYTEEKGSES